VAIEVGESIRLAPPVWFDCVAACESNGVELVSVPVDADRARLVDLAARLSGASEIAVFACPDPVTRLARDLVGLVHGAAAVTPIDILLAKDRTRALAVAAGISVPRGCAGPGTAIRAEAAALLREHGRVVVKDPHGYAGLAVWSVTDQARLAALLTGPGVRVVEEHLDGEEFSVELVCGPAGPTAVGWLAKGRTTSPVHPLERVRFAPPTEVPALLREPAERLLSAAGYRGIAEIDMVVAAGRAYLLECNPRTSGVTPTLHFAGRGSSMRRLVTEFAGNTLPRSTPVAAVDYQLGLDMAEPVPYGGQIYVQHPRPGTEFETRVFLRASVDELEDCLSRTDPVLGADFRNRVAAAESAHQAAARPARVGS
jgi:hypothetical protein